MFRFRYTLTKDFTQHLAPMGSKQFLSHIGGLRGIAILLVILFHLCPSVFPNCYYGVDIFLVITGYFLFLGSGKMDGTLKGAGQFALKKAERILPALQRGCIDNGTREHLLPG